MTGLLRLSIRNSRTELLWKIRQEQDGEGILVPFLQRTVRIREPTTRDPAQPRS